MIEERLVARFGTVGSLADARACGQAWAEKVKLATSMGDIVLELDRDKAPKTVENFVQYVKAGHYDGTVFPSCHRWLHDPGWWHDDGPEGEGHACADLAGEPQWPEQRARQVAMARTMDPNSATAQFFINLKDNAFLDAANARDGNGYAVFGKVVEGMAVVDKIRTVPTGNQGPHANVPTEPVIIRKATLEK